MLVIFYYFLKFDVKDFAKKLKHWVYHGYEELGDTGGCGLGRTTASVLSHRNFLYDPHKVKIFYTMFGAIMQRH